MTSEDTLQFILKGVLRRALDKTGVGATDAQQEAVIASVMADADWQAKARAAWAAPHSDETQIKDMRALLADCYMALHEHYHEGGGSHDQPPEPADPWSAGIIPVFVAIQRATGKKHDELMLSTSPIT